MICFSLLGVTIGFRVLANVFNTLQEAAPLKNKSGSLIAIDLPFNMPQPSIVVSLLSDALAPYCQSLWVDQ